MGQKGGDSGFGRFYLGPKCRWVAGVSGSWDFHEEQHASPSRACRVGNRSQVRKKNNHRALRKKPFLSISIENHQGFLIKID